MILLYHKISPETPTIWWVSVDAFNAQMAALQAYDVVSLDDYNPDNPRHAVITFDGVYENIYQYALPLLKKWKYPFELFVVGDTIGQGNEFDKEEPFARFASLEQLKVLVEQGARIQWHTKSHAVLNQLSESQVRAECLVPRELKEQFSAEHFQWFAYPHGIHSQDVVDTIKGNFRGACACEKGNDKDKYQYNRITVTEKTNLFKNKVTVIITNYNYGQYISEAIESVLSQTIPPDEFIIIDDCSSDNSKEIISLYQNEAKIVYNEKNLGVVKNFSRAVDLSSGDYIAFLGADNRMRCDYIEKCRSILDANEDAAVAYTDLSIFGDLSGELARNTENTKKLVTSKLLNWDIYYWKFPDPTEEVLKRFFRGKNFIHGSSMYRKKDYIEVGGYRDDGGKPEDFTLFRDMLLHGRKAIHVPHAVIEYRQHSSHQRNNILSYELTIRRQQKRIHELERALASASFWYSLKTSVKNAPWRKRISKKIQELRKRIRSKRSMH